MTIAVHIKVANMTRRKRMMRKRRNMGRRRRMKNNQSRMEVEEEDGRIGEGG
jgi:hypothetical protein